MSTSSSLYLTTLTYQHHISLLYLCLYFMVIRSIYIVITPVPDHQQRCLNLYLYIFITISTQSLLLYGGMFHLIYFFMYFIMFCIYDVILFLSNGWNCVYTMEGFLYNAIFGIVFVCNNDLRSDWCSYPCERWSGLCCWYLSWVCFLLVVLRCSVGEHSAVLNSYHIDKCKYVNV